MKKIYFFILFFIFSAIVVAQPSAKYFESIANATASYQRKEYKKSTQFYLTAFKSNGGKAYLEDRYNAARSMTLAGMKDSAFVQLFKVVQLYDYLNYLQISTEPDFSQLQSDKRWEEVLGLVKQNISKSDFNLNKSLVLLLDSVYRDHHSYRLKEVRIKNEFGEESKEVQSAKKEIIRRDSINLAIVTDILEKHGWLGRNVVGFIGNYTLALIIQYAPIETQDKYLPIIAEAYKNKNIEAYDYTSILDKVALRHGQPQLYGNIVVNVGNKNYVAPIQDVEHLDKRRADMGLKPMNSYLKSWSMKWDINKYKKDLLLLEKEKVEY